MLNHLPKNALKIIEKDVLYSKKPVIISGNKDRRSHKNDTKYLELMITLKIVKINSLTILIQNTCAGSL